MRDLHHADGFLPDLPLDIAIVRETIHKRTEYEASRLSAHAPPEPQQRCTGKAISVNN